MGLSIGIVGLPNVGKSTLFNALTKAQNAESANYPFCTIEPNKAIVPMHDARLHKLAKLVQPKNVIHATVDFVDIAGLVKGASQGEGLGNKFLENIRQTEVILHVVRCFEDEDIAHIDGLVNPLRDVETIETELILADMQMLERKIERLSKSSKGDKLLIPLFEEARAVYAHLESGNIAATYQGSNENLVAQVFNEPGLVSAKRVIYCANVDEDGIADDNDYVNQLRDYAEKHNAKFVKVAAKLEQDLVGLEDEEREEFLTSYSITESGIDKVVRTGFEMLGYINYFTAGPKEVRAWTIKNGWKAPKAASIIHNDFEKGFIRAEVISFEDYLKYRSEARCRDAGALRTEGKEYSVKDGDVMHYLFNV